MQSFFARMTEENKIITVSIPVIDDVIKISVNPSTTVEDVIEQIITYLSPKLPEDFNTEEFLYFGLLQNNPIIEKQPITKTQCLPFADIYSFEVRFLNLLI